MANPDVKIDEAQAKDWVKRVQGKLADVNVTLGKVTDVYNETVGSDDTIFQLMEKTSKIMKDTWDTTCAAFKRGWNILEEGIGVFSLAGQKIEDVFDTLKKDIR